MAKKKDVYRVTINKTFKWFEYYYCTNEEYLRLQDMYEPSQIIMLTDAQYLSEMKRQAEEDAKILFDPLEDST